MEQHLSASFVGRAPAGLVQLRHAHIPAMQHVVESMLSLLSSDKVCIIWQGVKLCLSW